MDDKPGLLKLSPEAKVGLFVLLGVVILVYMSLRVGGITFGRAEGYRLVVNFDSAAGLDVNASVRVAGVEVGKVKEITLKGTKAQIVLQINPDVQIRRDYTAVLTTKGLLGERYIELIPGSEPNAQALKEGDVITHTTSYADMDKLMTVLSSVAVDVKKITESLSAVLGGTEGEATLRNIVKNIEDISLRIDQLVAKNDEKFGHIMSNIDDFTSTLKEDTPEITNNMKAAINNLNSALLTTSNNINQMLAENRGDLREGVENLKTAAVKLQQAMDTINKIAMDVQPQIHDTMASVNSIARKVDKGEGTIGKLINDPSVHDNLNKTISGINGYLTKAESFHTYVGYRGEYMIANKTTKSYFSLRVQPKSDKYYLVDIINDPRGRRQKTTREITTGGNTTTTVENTTTDVFKFSIQIAKRFGNLAIRGGVIESTGGAGVDYYLFRDRLKVTFEGFDFSQKGNPHLKAGATLYFYKYFYLTGGYDDFASRYGNKSSFVGAGFQFDDDDIKYLLTSVPTSSLTK